ncbi:MAG TPA: type 2 lanthipeptide synthetase LanM family protein [Gaiellaceae bacterium]|nr:type 2 lanthipeptide synthetase LanM family protein [Gaiellaceae bacterium]
MSPDVRRAGLAQYKQWRDIAPFAVNEELASPEQLYGCDPDGLSAALGEPPSRFLDMLQAADWISDAEALVSTTQHSSITNDDLGDHGPLCALSPILSSFRSRVSDALLGFDTHTPGLCSLDQIIETFERPLRYRLLDRLLPALVLNLHQARAGLSGNTPEERYGDFISRIHDEDWRREFFLEYPIIARAAATMGHHAAASATEFLSRLYSDWSLIRTEFGLDDRDSVTEIRLAGDLHDRFRAVLVLDLKLGSKLVYKPRSVVVARHFQELIDWINERGLEPRLRTMKVVARGGYGWQEYVTAETCRDDDEARRFYARLGSLMALLYAVSATDVHSENIIAAGGDPVLVDHETLFQPEPSTTGKSRRERADRAFANSLAADGLWHLALLPSRRYSRDGSPGIDVSGLGGGEAVLGPLRVPTLVNLGRDDMRMELSQGENSQQQNRPTLGDVVLSVHDYRSDLLSGFQATCRLLSAENEGLLAPDGPLTLFASDRTRVLLRPTAQYALLLTSLGRPDLVRDGIQTDLHLDRFLSSAVSWRSAPAISHAEREELWFGDVPAFYSRASSSSIWTSSGRRIDRFFTNSGFHVVRRRVAGLDERRIQALSWEIEAAIDCSIATSNINMGPSTRLKPATPRKLSSSRPKRASGGEATKAVALELAVDFGHFVNRMRHDVGAYVNWPAIVDGDAAVTVQPAMGPGLYDGLSGIALFFAYLGEVLDRDDFREVALRSQQTARRFIDSFPGHWNIGAFGGDGGYLYVLLHLSHLWNDTTLLDECASRVVAFRERIQDDRQYDFIQGAAGLIPVLLGLHRERPSVNAISLAEQCGWHLVNNASEQVTGLGWAADDDPTPALLGMGHGAGGIACSLMSLYQATGEPRFRQVAADALVYERSLFDERKGDWPDLRRETSVDEEARHPRIAAWCHGAMGIGLSRCRLARDFADPRALDEIRTARDLTLEIGFGNNHSLCHGDLGNLELLREASAVLADSEIETARLQLAARIVSDIAENGYKTGITHGVDSLDLLRGVAGIGFGLLRIAAPTRVPSVLQLDGPPTRAR